MNRRAGAGLFVALFVFLVSGYELLALETSLPTISRIVQGWRDSGAHTVVTILAAACVAALAWFGAWLWHHFKYDRRSSL